jgi:hypothetical protein
MAEGTRRSVARLTGAWALAMVTVGPDPLARQEFPGSLHKIVMALDRPG